jgi:hypothetical protein
MKKRGWELSLEYDPLCFRANAAIDIIVESPERVAVELKYKTALFNATVLGRPTRLKNQSAQDVARYDFFRDISRVECVVASEKAVRGFAIFLTNDGGYWRAGRDGTADAMFRIHEGRSIADRKLTWGTQTSAGTMKGREEAISLTQDYSFGWNDYAKVDGKNGLFRYLMVEVDRKAV